MAMPRLSVIIPTYNRRPVLERCLRALREQTLDRQRFEVVVVDDGSSDDTGHYLAEQSDIRVWCQEKNGGPAAARNVGVRVATGEFVLFIGDDIYLAPDALERHLAVHERENRDGKLAVLGYCPWSSESEVTPLMRCVMNGMVFPQFDYYSINDGNDLPYTYFYTSNISLSKSMLEQHGLFDERFRFAMGEDGELGFRLQRAGLRIVYRPEIVGHHDHPTSYRSLRRRAAISGEVSYLLWETHPDIGDAGWLAHWTPRQHLSMRLKRTFVRRMMDPLLSLADEWRLNGQILWRAWNWALNVHKTAAFIDTATRRQPLR